MAHVEQAINSVRFPEMRANLHGFSESLSDEAYQQRVWIERQPSPIRDSFTDVVHFFYDDTTLAKNPDEWIGLILRDAAEVAAVKALTSAMDALFAELGTEQPDGVYVRASGWPQVVQLAKELIVRLERPGDHVAA